MKFLRRDEQIIKDIFKLRAEGNTISDIAAQMHITITEVCEVFFKQNNEDKYRSME